MIIAADTETTGPDIYHGCRAFMATMTTEEPNNLVWEWEVDPFTREVVHSPEKSVRDISDILWNNKIIFHNCLFDIPVFADMGCFDAVDYFENGDYEDTMVMAATLHSDGDRGLKKLSTRVGFSSEDEKELQKAVDQARFIARKREWRYARKGDDKFPGIRNVDGGFRNFDYWLPKAVALAELEDGNKLFDEDHPWLTVCEKYAVLDTERTFCIYYPLMNELKDENLWDRYKFTMSLMPAIWAMRSEGMPLYTGRAAQVVKKFRGLSKFHLQQASDMLGGINANSPKQLAQHLEDNLPGDIPKKKTPTGQIKTSEEVLMEYKTNDKVPTKIRESITNLLIGRKCDRTASLAENYIECLDRQPSKKYKIKGFGVIHSDINPVGTPVNRFSCKTPNAQAIRKREWEIPEMENIGVHIRQMFAPRRGREMWAVDFDQLHLRMIAYLSNETNMIRVFEEGGDIHAKTQRIIFQDQYIQGNGDQRRLAKDINFGYIYGAREAKITQYVNDSPIYHGSNDNGRVYRRMVDEFPNAPVFLEEKQQEAKEMGYILTADGTRLYLPKGKWYAAVNYYIQGTEGFLAKMALRECYKYLKDEDANVIMIIHDELLFDAYNGAHKEGLLLGVMGVMRKAGDEIGVKCEVEAKLITDSWYNGKVINPQELSA